MAADILVYRGTHVPVGEDQKQHLELARDIAQKFNNDYRDAILMKGYGEAGFFPQPEPIILGPATRVMSLRDGTKKMSKSDPSDLSRINLTDDAAAIARKIQQAKTDPGAASLRDQRSRRATGSGQPDRHLCRTYRNDTGATLREFGGGQFSIFKKALADAAVAKLEPITAEMRRLLGDTAEIDRILADGARRARVIAQPIMTEVKDIVGFVQS